MTTVGYGDLAPITPLERACSIFGMLIACMIFTYTIGSISHLVTKNGIHVAQYKQQMIYVNQFLLRKGISKEMRTKIRRYLEYNLNIKEQQKIDKEDVMKALNKNLQIQM